MTPELCPCGLPLHYTDRRIEGYVRTLIHEHGPTVEIHTPEGVWRVPRHYIALHGVKAENVPQLAAHYGWERR